ncbi:MAG TPA: energy transducer TonB [Candidatus Binatia bacterium]|nr:energy transducer TonB [Candidatus Binatia bacterium]
MLDEKARSPRTGRPLLRGETPSSPPRQRRVMVLALLLLLVSLGFVLYRDRDFWFPDTEEADDQPLSAPTTEVTPSASTAPKGVTIPRQKKQRVHESVPVNPQVDQDSPSGATVTATRTVLPPLEVEVVAGDAHRTLRPGTNSVHVDLQGTPPRPGSTLMQDDTSQSAAQVTTPAAQRALVSSTAEVVSHSIQPDYPMLARQMRVQGSVIMQALIGRDGLIQDLRVLSGPPILANAAEEAVRQWHFKPHYVGSLPVETRANITVNFTISTN